MGNKRVTKIDPDEKLAHYLRHQSESKNTRSHKKAPLSASLKQLNAERKKALFRRLGLIISLSLLVIIVLGYYISPVADVSSIKIVGADDLPAVQIAKTADIDSSNKILHCMLTQQKLKKKLLGKYNEIKDIRLHVNGLNHLVLQIDEYPAIGYIKLKNGYRKIITGGKLGTANLPWSEVDQSKPMFIGYDHELSLEHDIKLFNSLPAAFQEKVKLLSGNTQRASQIIFVMKDGNVVIGNAASIKDKLWYYDEIRKKAEKNSVIDMEVGVFSRPLTAKEKKIYGVS
ncbi:cell division protein FtsQ [Lactobacillus sp. ESL0791]|uniref:cell division protein FtsQ n=1 Tax=Lactobacillus sp. ESL0791 TaxID=2983234 RepID=UPI0023F688CB|nr:cell division protein FtsQ [Lactobacillus sp. ESL0791]MDF7638809.1 cell division protein FtsQ [Lactobacillus sp. ESL0791]